jgi:hypothetical protein
MDQGGGKLKPARPTAGEPARGGPCELAQLEIIDRALRGDWRAVQSVNPRAKAQIVEDREVCVKRQGLGHVADAFSDVPRTIHQVATEYLSAAIVGFEDPGEYS